ncbi:MAG TPA: hypothetical protein VG345_16570 [Bryobacteraceae bacterium]|jgi:hypothetical protein|nr:hypothetical protein [Bryobacteraceae bacterium]
MQPGDEIELIPAHKGEPARGKFVRENSDGTIVVRVDDPEHEWHELEITADAKHYRVPGESEKV